MSQGSVYERGNQQQQHGWETTSHDYNLHISRIEKMTSFLPDVPRYLVLHRFFNNRIVSEEQPKKKNKSPSKSLQRKFTSLIRSNNKKKNKILFLLNKTSIPKLMDSFSRGAKVSSYANGRPLSCIRFLCFNHGMHSASYLNKVPLFLGFLWNIAITVKKRRNHPMKSIPL
ncbi:hypothetical protein M5689_016322 [Euphorbia peplus]|nr:hypothetical protein M5689_016322 [Euphorbia peplus]